MALGYLLEAYTDFFLDDNASRNPKPFAQGTFRFCCKGTYTEGRRRGEACVAKYFKAGTSMSKAFFSNDIKAVSRTLQIVRAFNRQKVLNKTIIVSIPEVWTGKQGQKILVEPFIKGFVKWNSNSGWSDEYTAWARVMQSLSHFSYHCTQGQFLLCDLQGGIYDKGAVLTDPVIMSRTRAYGVTDLGAEGMSNFFSGHRCNEYCSRSWIHPAGSRRSINPIKGTTMKYVATQSRKPRFTYSRR